MTGEATPDVWGSASYERFSAHHAGAIEHLLRLVPPEPGARWLDLGTGTGEVALPAAAAGAEVHGCDPSPGMIATARRRAAEAGLEIAYGVADAREVPYPDAHFDAVVSSYAINLVPDFPAVARELARVCRPGGRLGIVTVVPDRGQSEIFEVLLRYMAAPPGDGPDPYLWADRGYVDGLLGPYFTLDFTEGDAPQCGRDGAAMWALMSEAYGPAHALTTALDPPRRRRLAADAAAVYERHRVPGGGIRMPRPYLIIRGERRDGPR